MLEWPFFEDRHREFAAWAASTCPRWPRPSSTRAAARFVRALAPTAGCEHAVAEPLDVRTLCLARETLAYHDALADFAFAMQGLGSGPITLFGDDELRARVPAGGRGGREDRGVRAVGARGRLRRGGDDDDRATDERITGTKTWISNGGIADFYTVFARAPEGITAYVVDAEHVEVVERIDVIAPHPLATLGSTTRPRG